MTTPRDPDPAANASREAIELERLKHTMSQLPDQAVPIQPPPILPPRIISLGQPVAIQSTGRFLLAADADSDKLLIIDTRDGQVCGYSTEPHRDQLEALLALANRPE